MTDTYRANLIREAECSMQKSYSPYSNNKVGAALITETGQIYLGANIGNACSTLNCCAEQVAVSAAVMSEDMKFKAIAIVQSSGDSCLPCGRCLQLLSEFADDMIVLTKNAGAIVEYQLKFLLPVPFRRSETLINR